jgi:dephospho-CoA kinase
MKTVGLTGGIGSGKSTVLKIFSALGVPCYMADDRSKILLDKNPILKRKLIHVFGEIYKDGKIDRRAFANCIFNDEKKLKIANNIIHPFVREDFRKWVLAQNTHYVIQEAAILFETGAYKFFDKNILITAPKGLRIKRLLTRGNFSEMDIMERMESQWEEDKKELLADYCIVNNEIQSLIQQVLKIHYELSS